MTPEPQGMGEMSRVAGVFFEPKKTFEDIARRPTFWVPLLISIIFGLAFTQAVGQRIGWERVVRHQMEMSSRNQQATPEQREKGVQMGVKIASVISYLGPILGVVIYTLVTASVLLGIVAGIMSAPVKFKQVFAVCAWAGVPGILFAVLGIIVMYLKPPEDFNINNPLVFNPGAMMDPQTSSKFVYSLASSLDLFSLWAILLIATGLKAAAGMKLSFGGAMFSVLLPWGVFVLGRAALAGVFS